MLGFDYQGRVAEWVRECFGADAPYNKAERAHRFLEEAVELYQATGQSKENALKLVEYVYSRPMGEQFQEVGGVMVTLAALCDSCKIPMFDAASVELTRCWQKIDKIRAKNKAKKKDSALPGYAE
jgi:hypothetical protein